MALNAQTCIQAINTRLENELDIDLSLQEKDAALNIIIEEIIEHFKNFAVINTNTNSTVVVTSVSGVTPGAGVSGPGAGTATGTGVGTIS